MCVWGGLGAQKNQALDHNQPVQQISIERAAVSSSTVFSGFRRRSLLFPNVSEFLCRPLKTVWKTNKPPTCSQQ